MNRKKFLCVFTLFFCAIIFSCGKCFSMKNFPSEYISSTLHISKVVYPESLNELRSLTNDQLSVLINQHNYEVITSLNQTFNAICPPGTRIDPYTFNKEARHIYWHSRLTNLLSDLYNIEGERRLYSSDSACPALLNEQVFLYNRIIHTINKENTITINAMFTREHEMLNPTFPHIAHQNSFVQHNNNDDDDAPIQPFVQHDDSDSDNDDAPIQPFVQHNNNDDDDAPNNPFLDQNFTDDNGVSFKVLPNNTVEITAYNKINPCTESLKILNTVQYKGVNFTISSVGNKAFQNMPLNFILELPDSLKNIHREAFYGCSTQEIRIPNKELSQNAYINCTSTIMYKGEDQDWKSDNECPICLSNVNRLNIFITACGHRTCIDCINRILETSENCPVCRNNIFETKK